VSLVVSNTAALTAAISSAHGGDTILLAPGTYDWFQLLHVHIDGNLTITSQDPTHAATLTSMGAYDISGITFSDLNVKLYTPQNSGMSFLESNNVTIDHVTFLPPPAGFQQGPGVLVNQSTNIKILNSDIGGYGTGISLNGDSGILVQGNSIHDVTADGIDAPGTSNVTISGNTFTNFHSDPGVHADAIQFFTAGTPYTTSHDITISSNTMIRGSGSLFQGIFLENDGTPPYQNITIQNNALVGTMFNGIYVEVANNVHIDHNLVTGYTDEISWIYANAVTNLSVTNNESSAFKTVNPSNPGMVQTNDTTILQISPGDAAHLLQTFGGSIGAPALNSPVGSGSASLTTPTIPVVSSPVVSTPPATTTAPATATQPASTTTGDHTLTATSADATLQGDSGNDSIVSGGGHTYLRGGDGNDQVVGGSGFDDINGNPGNDTITSGAGDDWALGGQGNDNISGEDGNDLVLGNLGADSLTGGAGNDTVRGGQGDDTLSGGAGNDWLSGDLGSDTMTGGAGADIFHSFNGAGIDVVKDFSVADGDRVMLDPGTVYHTAQVGADLVITFGTAGDQMILQNVQSASLPTGWIFE
jgi:Ca2+-binding RTX toxin-like protein